MISSPFSDLGWLFASSQHWLAISTAHGKQCQELTVEEALQKDPRPPILYLRPFQADKLKYSDLERQTDIQILSSIGGFAMVVARACGIGRKRHGEELIVDVLGQLGPVIAIGRPHERIPPVGAARMYVGDDWQDIVRKYLSKAQFILMFAGTTPGFAWEIGEIFRTTPFKPTMILLPFHMKRGQKKHAKVFLDIFAEASGLPVPDDVNNIRAIYILDRQDIRYVEADTSRSGKELNKINPFLIPISKALEIDRKGWGDDYLAQAKEENKWKRQRATKIACGISGIMFVLGLLMGFISR